MKLPRIRHGIGILSAALINGISAAIESVHGRVEALEKVEKARRHPVTKRIIVKITDAQLSGSIYEHSWVEQIWDDSADEFIDKTGGLTSTTGTDDFAQPAYQSDGGRCEGQPVILMNYSQGDEADLVRWFEPVCYGRVVAGKITSNNGGGSNTTYDAEAVNDSELSVTGATPVNRIVSTADINWAAAAVDDLCLFLVAADGTVSLWVAETASVDECDDDNVSSAEAFTTDNSIVRVNGAGRVVQQSGVTIDDSDNLAGINDADVGGTLSVDTMTESTADAGITAESVGLKDGNASLGDGKGLLLGDDEDGRIYESGGNLVIEQATDAKDIILALGSGDPQWEITFDESAKQIVSSSGEFDFDDDDVLTSGIVQGKTGAFFAYRNAALTLVNGANTTLDCDTEVFDSEGWFNTTTHRYTPLIEGYYYIVACVGIVSLNNAKRLVAVIEKNGVQYATPYGISTGVSTYHYAAAPALVYMNGSTDYLEPTGYHNNGSDRSAVVGTSPYVTYMFGWLARAA